MAHAPAYQRNRQKPAWAFSVCAHLLAASLMAVSVARAPRGAADEESRAVGIVIRKANDSRTMYEGEQAEVEADSQAPERRSPDTEAVNNAIAEVVAQADASEFTAHLPPATSPGEATERGLGPSAATGMTAGGGASPSGGRRGETTVNVFGVQGTGRKFVYLFDHSTSMNGAPLAAAKQQLLASLESLDSTHQFQILFFNYEVTPIDVSGQGRIAFATDDTRRAAARLVDRVPAIGGTDRHVALRRALSYNPDVIFFLTDADDAMPESELREIAEKNERVGATICAIEFGRGPEHGRRNFLVALSQMTGGQYGYVDTTRLTRE